MTSPDLAKALADAIDLMDQYEFPIRGWDDRWECLKCGRTFNGRHHRGQNEPGGHAADCQYTKVVAAAKSAFEKSVSP